MKVDATVTLDTDRVILREHIGDFIAPDGAEGTLCLGPSGPVIEIGGAYVTFSWQTLIGAAVSAIEMEDE